MRDRKDALLTSRVDLEDQLVTLDARMRRHRRDRETDAGAKRRKRRGPRRSKGEGGDKAARRAEARAASLRRNDYEAFRSNAFSTAYRSAFVPGQVMLGPGFNGEPSFGRKRSDLHGR